MKRAVAFGLAMLLCLSLCACADSPAVAEPAPTPTPEQTPADLIHEKQILALGYDPQASLHPIKGESQTNRLLTSLVYESLYSLDETFEPYPVLAIAAEEDESGLVWTLTMVENRVFSDGTPMTAEHAAASVNMARKSTLYEERLKSITSVRASGNQLVITLERPNGMLPALLDIPVVLETQADAAPLGSGRYRFAQDGERLYLMANYNREGEVPYATIELVPVSASDERIAAFDAGEVNAVLTDFSSPYALGYSCDYEVWDYPTTDMLFIGFNTQDGPCGEALIRQAFSRCFDRAEVVKTLLSGHGDASAIPVSPANDEWVETYDSQIGYNRVAAAELFDMAGYFRSLEDGLLYRNRELLEVTLLVNSDNVTKCAVADFVAEEMTSLGVSVFVLKLPWKDYLTALNRGEFDLYLGEIRMTADFDLTEMISGGLNYGKYENEQLVQAASERKETSGHARYWEARVLWGDFVQEVPFAPLCFKRESLLFRWDALGEPTPRMGDPFYGLENWPEPD